MNPKAIPRNKLLGSIDIDTREWSDGVLTYAARQVTLDSTLLLFCSASIVLTIFQLQVQHFRLHLQLQHLQLQLKIFQLQHFRS